MAVVLTVVRYPFTRGALVLVLATLVGALPYGGILTLLVTTSFCLPVVRATARGGPDGDRMPRLLPPYPGLPVELATGALLALVYFGPFLLLIALAFLADDVPELGFLNNFAFLLLLPQLGLVLAWPAAVALLASGEHPFTILTKRVLKKVEEIGPGYGIVAAWLFIAGGIIMCGSGQVGQQGLIGDFVSSALASWFWLITLYLLGRSLRGQPPFVRPETAGGSAAEPAGS